MKKQMIVSVCLLFSVWSFSAGAQNQDQADVSASAETAAGESVVPAAADTADQKKAPQKKKDEYLGIEYTPERTITLKSGDVRLVLRRNPGVFNLYAIQKSGVANALLATYDTFRSTFFSIMVNKSIYRLNREASVVSELRRTDESVQIAYTIDKEAQIVVDFKCMATVPGVPDDMVKVTVYTTNLDKRAQNFALKAVFDTILGENSGTHFSTAAHASVDSEMQFVSMKDDRWIISSNGRSSIQFLFDGPGITVPDLVSLGNKDVLALAPWDPAVVEKRSFNSVLAYNNSAVGVNWNPVTLDPGQTQETVFYIVVGTDGEKPAGEKFLSSLEPQTTGTVSDRQEPVPAAAVIKPNVPAPVPAAPAAPAPAVEFVVPPVTDAQLDPVYIQNLIDRINSLQSDPNLVDRTEIRQLNAELDAILAKIRQQPK